MEAYCRIQGGMPLPRYGRVPGMLSKSLPSIFATENSGPLHATDAWNLGTLIYEMFNGAFSNADQLNNKGVIPQDLFTPYKRLLNPAPKARLSVSQFLDLGCRAGSFFSTDLIKCSESLENMSIKNDHERDLFIEYIYSLSC